MLKGEIANSKNMASLRICPRVDIRQKKKKNRKNLIVPSKNKQTMNRQLLPNQMLTLLDYLLAVCRCLLLWREIFRASANTWANCLWTHPRTVSFIWITHPRTLSFKWITHPRTLSFIWITHPKTLSFIWITHPKTLSLIRIITFCGFNSATGCTIEYY